jgi:hypothetical protein
MSKLPEMRKDIKPLNARVAAIERTQSQGGRGTEAA